MKCIIYSIVLGASVHFLQLSYVLVQIVGTEAVSAAKQKCVCTSSPCSTKETHSTPFQ